MILALFSIFCHIIKTNIFYFNFNNSIIKLINARNISVFLHSEGRHSILNTELTKENLQKNYGKVSPFEFKDKLLQLAAINNDTILDAGRGNPNWTAATPRQAFFTFGQFAILETPEWFKKMEFQKDY